MRRLLRATVFLGGLYLLNVLLMTGANAADPGDEFWSSDFSHVGVQGKVYAALSEPDALYIGGYFQLITSEHVANVARLEFVNGVATGVYPLGAGLSNRTTAFCKYEGDLIATGYFDHSGTTQLDHVGRWDGQAWHPVGGGLPDNVVNATVAYQGQLFAGAFRWDGSRWSNFFETDGAVTCLVVHDGLLYVGGTFTQVRGQDVAHVFAWDGAEILALGTGLPGDVVGATTGPQGVVFGWNTSQTMGQVVRWTGVEWIVEQDLNEGVISVAYLGEDLVVSNTNENGYPPYFSIITRSLKTNRSGEWVGVGSFGPKIVAEHEGRLILATDESVEDGVVSGGLLGFDGDNLHPQFPLGAGCDTGFNQLARIETSLVASGSYKVAGGQAIDGSGLWCEGTWFGWDNYEHTAQGIPGSLEDLEAVGTEFYGLMNYFDYDISYNGLMKLFWDTDRWVWKSLLMPDPVWFWKLQAVGDKLYGIGGYDGVEEIHQETGWGIPVAGLDLDYWIANSCEYQSSLVICGNFTTNAGLPVSNVLRYVGEQWVDVGERLPGQVELVEPMDGQRLAAVVYDGNERQVAVFDGLAWSLLPGEFADPISRLTFHRDRLFAAGNFGQVGVVPARSIAVWTGDQWAPVGSGLTHSRFYRIHDMISTGDRLWVTGTFSYAGGHASVGLAQWSGDPTLITGEASGVAEDLPVSAGLLGAPYPNPFNPRTELAFQLETSTPVQVGIFDLQGRRVRELANETYSPGTHRLTWNGLDDSGRALPSGVYFARLSTDNRTDSVKLTLVR